MVAPPAEQQQQAPDAGAPAAEEQKKDDAMGDNGGKMSAEAAECFPEIGQAEDESSQPSAKKPAAAKAECTATAPEQDSLLKSHCAANSPGDTCRKGHPW